MASLSEDTKQVKYEVEGRDCIEYEDTLYCADGPGPEQAEGEAAA